MALTKEQQAAKDETSKRVTQGIEAKAGKFIKENYELLKVAFPQLPAKESVTNADFMKMAQDAIDKRAISYKSVNGRNEELSLDAINEKIMKDPKSAKFVTDRGAANVHELVPTREQATTVANEAGFTTTEDLGGWLPEGATLGNGVKGAWNWVKSFGQSGGLTESVTNATATSMGNNAETRLKALKSNRPDMKFLSDSAIKEISAGISNGVKNRSTAAAITEADPLKDVEIKPMDEALRDNIREQIYLETYEKTKKAIQDRVNSQVNKIRNGEGFGGGIMGAIMGFIFKIAEMIGADKFLAKMAGTPIPTESEINDVAAKTATSVSTAMTATTKEHGGQSMADLRKGPNADAQVEAAVAAKVQGDLAENNILSKEQISEIAATAGKGIRENLASIPLLDDPKNPTELATEKARKEALARGTSPDRKPDEPSYPDGQRPPPRTIVASRQAQGMGQST